PLLVDLEGEVLLRGLLALDAARMRLEGRALVRARRRQSALLVRHDVEADRGGAHRIRELDGARAHGLRSRDLRSDVTIGIDDDGVDDLAVDQDVDRMRTRAEALGEAAGLDAHRLRREFGLRDDEPRGAGPRLELVPV